VSLKADRYRTYAVDYGSIPGLGELAAALLNPFGRSRLPEIPGILQVLILSMLANRRYDLPLGDTDSVFRPSFSSDVNSTSWDRHAEILRSTYEQAVAWIRARLAEGDEALRALIH
jgi:NTE family protein